MVDVTQRCNTGVVVGMETPKKPLHLPMMGALQLQPPPQFGGLALQAEDSAVEGVMEFARLCLTGSHACAQLLQLKARYLVRHDDGGKMVVVNNPVDCSGG